MSNEEQKAQNHTDDQSQKSDQIKPSFWEERFKVSAFRYSIPKQANTLAYSLGGTITFAFLIMLATGMVLAQYFDPRIETAHQSIDYIMREATLGWFIRGMHYWSAQIMYVLLLLHLTRIIITAAYKRPREFTYYFGLTLFLLFTLMVTVSGKKVLSQIVLIHDRDSKPVREF